MPRSLIRVTSMDGESARRFVEECIALGPDQEALADAVAALDWSGVDKADGDTERILGALDGAVTAYCESDATWGTTVDELRKLVEQPGKRRASA
jgi:hypothetical protein